VAVLPAAVEGLWDAAAHISSSLLTLPMIEPAAALETRSLVYTLGFVELTSAAGAGQEGEGIALIRR
jgi:hypothetical protein